LSNQNRKS